MSLTKGRVSFCQFNVTGDIPDSVDQIFLDVLYEHRFTEVEIGQPDEIEVGFVTAEHLFDTAFSYQKTAYGRYALFALRIDTHKVPAEVKAAYQKMHEQAAAASNPSGFASKNDKRDAKELAGRQLNEDLAAGKFRKSKSVELMWDLPNARLYCANSSGSVCEQVVKIMKRAFAVDVEQLTAGRMAAMMLDAKGRSRDFEDVSPSPYTKPPAYLGDPEDEAAAPRERNTPPVPWTTKSLDLKDFLGNEFLIWLWWRIETSENIIGVEDVDSPAKSFATITKTLDMDCAWQMTGKQMLRGDKPTSLPEANDALKTGKWPRKMGLILADPYHQWDLTIQGDQFNVSAAQLPEIEDAMSPREVIEARLAFIGHMSKAINLLFAVFVQRRTATGWGREREAISKWIRSRK